MKTLTLVALLILTATRPIPVVAGTAPSSIHYLLVEGDPGELARRFSGLAVRACPAGPDRFLVVGEESEIGVLREAVPGALGAGGPHPRGTVWRVTPGTVPPDELVAWTVVEHDDLWLVVVPDGEGSGAVHHRLETLLLDGRAVPLPPPGPLEALIPRAPGTPVHPYRRGRMHDPAARGRARALAGQVDQAEIETIVRALAEVTPGVPGSREARRPEMNDVIVPYLVQKLEDVFAAPGDTVFLDSFVLADSTLVHNLIGRRPGRSPGAGRYILGGHYDATAGRTEGWDPAVDPAPGANDNATGVAAAIEAARVLLGAEFEFGIEVVLFGAEELGLIGSRHLVGTSELRDQYAPGEVIGVIVTDMVGHDASGLHQLDVITNGRSEWLADLLTGAAQVLAPEDTVRAVKFVDPSFGGSDHGPFWSIGGDAVLVIEDIDVRTTYPHYHRVTDTVEFIESVDAYDLTRRSAELIVATLGQFTMPEGVDLNLTAESLQFRDPSGRSLLVARVGEPARISAQLLNTGATLMTPVRVLAEIGITPSRRPSGKTFALGGNPTPTATTVATIDTTFSLWESGTWRELAAVWVPGGEHGGAQDAIMEIQVEIPSTPVLEYTASGTVRVVGPSLEVLDAYLRPNPVRGSLSGSVLSFQLNRQGDVTVIVHDILGTRVGAWPPAGSGPGVGFFDVGRVEIPLDAVISQSPLPSGLYRVRIRADGSRFQQGQSTAEVTLAYMR